MIRSQAREFRVRGLGHLQLAVTDPAASRDFYQRVLGMEEFFSDLPQRIFLRAGADIFTLVRAAAPLSGSALHFGFVMETPEEMERALGRLLDRNVPIDAEQRDQAGWSIYFRDPDGYRIEFLWLTDNGRP